MQRGLSDSRAIRPSVRPTVTRVNCDKTKAPSEESSIMGLDHEYEHEHQLVSDQDDALFERIQANEHHVLRQLLPSTTSHNYGLRSRRHNYTLNVKAETHCRNFITRLLYKDMY